MRWPRFFAILTFAALAALAFGFYGRARKPPISEPASANVTAVDAVDAAPIVMGRADAAPPTTLDAGPKLAVTVASPADASPIRDLLGTETDHLTAPLEVWQRRVAPKFAQWFTADETAMIIGWLMDMCQESISMIRDDARRQDDDREATHAMLDTMTENRRAVVERILALANGRVTREQLRKSVLGTVDFGEACMNVEHAENDGGP